MKDIVYKLFPKIHKTPKNHGRILVLMYHEVQKDDKEIESWTVIKLSDFETQMLYLKENYIIISVEAAVELLKSRNPLDNNYIVITFDDGYSGNYDIVYPIISKYNIPITIYVATKACLRNEMYWYDHIINALQAQYDYFIDLRIYNNKVYNIKAIEAGEDKWTKIQILLEDMKKMQSDVRDRAVNAIVERFNDHNCKLSGLRHLTINEINLLSQSPLVTIGAHSHCHNLLTTISDTMSLQSIVESKHLLEHWTSKSVRHFSYPNGDYNESIENMVKQTGLITSVTTRPGFWKHSDSFFEIPRLGIGRYDSIDKFKFRVRWPSNEYLWTS